MLNFRTIGLKDKPLFDSYLVELPHRNCEFSFFNLFCWKEHSRITYDIVNGFLVMRSVATDDNLPSYIMPLGTGDLTTVLEILMADAKANDYAFRMISITRDMFAVLEELMPGQFSYTPMRASADYIYATEDLRRLAGNKYQSKRNHINRFKRDFPDFEFVPISKDLIPACLEMQKLWNLENGCADNDMLISEAHVIEVALDNFEELQLSGGVIKTNGQIIAFSYGHPIGKDTFGVHVEKALNGAYAIINQQMAEHVACNYAYINREEDLGMESLRKAKLSYHPAILLEKGSVQIK